VSDFNETFVITREISGNLAVAAGAISFAVPSGAELVSVHAKVGTAPASTDVLIDVNKNGTTIFTDQAKRVKITAGTTTGSVKNEPALAPGTNYIYTPYPTANPLATFAEGDTVSVDVDQIGTGTVGANLGVVLTFIKK
jgi:hypothetical protein